MFVGFQKLSFEIPFDMYQPCRDDRPFVRPHLPIHSNFEHLDASKDLSVNYEYSNSTLSLSRSITTEGDYAIERTLDM
jgi:hypothetical protein